MPGSVRTVGVLVACAIVAGVLGCAVALPAVWTMVDVLSSARAGDAEVGWLGLGASGGRRLALTLGVALVIAALATALGWPIARVLSRGPRVASCVLVALPLLMPAYLAYSGWGELRAPDTVLGQWLARGPSWRAIAFGKTLAILGLAAWSAPLAALVLAPSLATVSRQQIEAAAGASPVRRLWLHARLARGAPLRAAALVFLVMLGSAVPLHLAQVETLAIHVWRTLAETGPDGRWRAWLAAWPLLVVALVAAAWIAGSLTRGAAPGGVAPPRCPKAMRAFAIGIVGVGVVAPGALMAWRAGGVAPIVRFVDFHGAAIADSLVLAAALGGLGAALAVSVGYLLGTRARLLGVAAIAGLAFTALTPGVLVGAAFARLGVAAWWPLDGVTLHALAMLARFGVVAAVAGALMVRAEPVDLADARQQLGDGGPASWLRATAPATLGLSSLAGLATAALTLHEIEATVLVLPAGRGSLAQVLLDLLHYNRERDLAAGTALVVAGGSALAIAAAGVAAVLRRRASRSPIG